MLVFALPLLPLALLAALALEPSAVPPLRNAHFRDPLVGGVLGGYAGDTGLDIGGMKLPVYAIAAGTLDYAEWGHTRWVGPKDTAYCARITLDEPVPYRGHLITHVYYAHMSAVAEGMEQAESAPVHRHVEAGARLGTSGIANGSWHLHLGLLLDGRVEQDDWDYILREDEVRAVLGGYLNGRRI
jgi:murein DD-endopeptidase MepM/ murein hydrolase activator NlpD